MLHCQQEIRFAISQFGSHLITLERSGRTCLNFRFNLSQVLLREVNVCNPILLVTKGKNQIPVRLLDASDSFDRCASKISIGLLKLLASDLDQATVAVSTKISKQGLGISKAQTGRIDRAGAGADRSGTYLCL